MSDGTQPNTEVGVPLEAEVMPEPSSFVDAVVRAGRNRWLGFAGGLFTLATVLGCDPVDNTNRAPVSSPVAPSASVSPSAEATKVATPTVPAGPTARPTITPVGSGSTKEALRDLPPRERGIGEKLIEQNETRQNKGIVPEDQVVKERDILDFNIASIQDALRRARLAGEQNSIANLEKMLQEAQATKAELDAKAKPATPEAKKEVELALTPCTFFEDPKLCARGMPVTRAGRESMTLFMDYSDLPEGAVIRGVAGELKVLVDTQDNPLGVSIELGDPSQSSVEILAGDLVFVRRNRGVQSGEPIAKIGKSGQVRFSASAINPTTGNFTVPQDFWRKNFPASVANKDKTLTSVPAGVVIKKKFE